jgi:hypothetical protein
LRWQGRLPLMAWQPMQVRPEFVLTASGEHGKEGAGGSVEHGELDDGGAKSGQDGKTYLPWSVYRKEQKMARGRGPKRKGGDDGAEEKSVVKQRRKMGKAVVVWVVRCVSRLSEVRKREDAEGAEVKREQRA